MLNIILFDDFGILFLALPMINYTVYIYHHYHSLKSFLSFN